MIQVPIQVSLLSPHCKPNELQIIASYVHASVDGHDLLEISLSAALEVVIVVVIGCFKGETAIRQLAHDVHGRESETKERIN